MSKKKETPLLRRFTPYMGKKKILLPLALVMSGLSAILNMIPFVMAWYIAREILSNPGSTNLPNVETYAWIALGTALGGVILYFLALMCSHLAAFRVEVGMQKVGMKKIINMPLGFFDQYSSGKVRKIINDGAGTTHTFLAHQLPDLAGTILSPIILLVLIFTMNWRLGLASLIPIIIGIITMMSMTTAKGKSFQKQYFDALEEMSSEFVEYVRGIPVVKTFGQSIFSFKRFYNSIVRYKEMVYAYTLLWRIPMSFYTVIMQSAAFFLIPAAILMLGSNTSISVVIADYIFYLLISPIFTMLLMKSMYFQQNSMIAKQAIDRVDDLFAYPEMKYPDKPKTMKGNTIEFKNVVFAYEGAEKNALDGVSFTVSEGETIALVGPSGGGKTTIARLAARFFDVKSGEVLLGGENVKNLSKVDVMNHISFVFQNTKLFKGTLEENIVFGKENVTKKDIEKAVKLSQSKEIIDGLEEGLQTVIGSKGTYLSGGEQQRIALARAIVKDAPVVLLDEATAFADPENEHLIQKALYELSKGKTTLMIAHRLTSVKNVDKILVINEGKIQEQGTHDELMDLDGMYKVMWNEYLESVAWKVGHEDEEEKVYV